MLEKWYHFQWPWLTLARISKSRHFWSRISEKRRVLKTNLLFHTNRKLYLTTHGMVLCWPWLTSTASRGFVSVSWTFLFIPSIGTWLFWTDFKVSTFLQVNYLILRVKLLLNTNKHLSSYIQYIEWNHFQWPWLALDRNLKVEILFHVEYLRHDRT